MADLLKPKEITATTLDGETRTYIISRVPAVQAREIMATYPMSALPKIGDYKVNEQTMLAMMKFVAAQSGDTQVRLETRVLVDNHVPDWEVLFQIEKAMLSYNTSFFTKEKTSDFFGTLKATARQWLIETLTDLSAASSRQTKRP